ncbi:hypothetical protein Tco_0888968 [Tanacetum coccineum]
MLQARENLMGTIQAFLKEYDHIPPEEKCMALLLAKERFLKIKQAVEEEQNQPEAEQAAKSFTPYGNFSMIDDVKVLQDRKNLMKDIQTFLRKFSRIPFGEIPKVLLVAWERFSKIKHAFTDKQYQQEDIQELMIKLLKIILLYIESLLSTFSAEEIVPIPRESEDTSRSDSKNVLPSCEDPRDDFVTFSNPLFEFDVNFNSSDENPLCDEVLEDIECKDSYDSNLDESTFLVTPLSDSNKDECLTLEDDIEFLLHHNPSTPLKSVASILEGFINDPFFEENDDLFDLECKTNDWITILYDAPIDEAECFNPGGDNDEINAFLAIKVPTDPLHHEFTGELITIPPGIVREHEDYINRMSLLCGNSSSRSPENSHTIIDSLPTSTTPIEDSDSNREEIDIFFGPDDSIPPGVESDFDSKEDIIDNLLNDDPIPEYERLTFNMEPDVPVINNVDELNEDECFDPGGGEINVEVDDSFTFVTRTFLPYLTYPEVSPLLSSTKNEDTIFDPDIST